MSDSSWLFDDKNGNTLGKVTFAHIERDEELEKWQGSQICEMDLMSLHISAKIPSSLCCPETDRRVG